MKPLPIELFTIRSANYYSNNYSLYLSSEPSLNFIHNTFHVSKVKPYLKNNSTVFPQCQLGKPGPVSQDRYEVEKVIKYRKALQTGAPQYKVGWLGYSFEDNQWMDAKNISTGILQDFCTKGRLENSFKRRCTNNG